MNVPKDILDFAERWQEKTTHYGSESLADVFDHFFSAFVLYNFLYNQITEGESYNFDSDEERATKSIRKYLGAEMIFNDPVIRDNAERIKTLISNGTFYIRDSAWDSQRIKKLESPDKETWGKGLMEMIYKIRCNTFHGSKRFAENQKNILIPCINIIERVNSMVVEIITAHPPDAVVKD